MVKVQLRKILINNFRGIASSLHLFNEKSVVELSAPFGSGKTTTFEAFLYAMGYPIKNTKPCKYENNRWVEIPNVKTSVELLLSVVNGSEEEDLSLIRQENAYFVNDVKITTLANYQKAILNILGIDSLELYSDLLYLGHFNERDEKTRRNILLELTGTNKLLVETQDSYDLLKQDFINGLTNDEIEKQIKKELKEAETKQVEINSKLEVLKSNIGNYNYDFEALEQRKIELEIELQEETGIYVDYKNDILKKKENLLKELQTKNEAIAKDKRNLESSIDNYARQIMNLSLERGKTKQKLEEAKNREIDNIIFCPTCKTRLPENNDLNIALEEEKERDIQAFTEELHKLNLEIKQLEEKNVAKRKELNNLINSTGNLTSLNEKIRSLDVRLSEFEIANQPNKTKIEALQKERDDVFTKLGAREFINNLENEKQECIATQKQLLNKIKQLSQKSIQLKQYLSQIEQITTNNVNKAFENTDIQWQLYDNLKTNGNLSVVLEMLYKGKRYSSCSRGERLIADYLLISFLQEQYQIHLPIFVDNYGDLGDELIDTSNNQTILLKTDFLGQSLVENITH